MDYYYALNNREDKNKPKEVRISDIIKISQDISSNWLEKEAEKKILTQEQSKQQRDKSNATEKKKKKS